MKKDDITYSEAMEQIGAILRRIDSPDVDIDTLGTDVKRASELIKLCKTKLRKAEAEVEKALED